MESLLNLKMNKYQTPFTPELLEKLPNEVVEEVSSFITSIPFIQNLISPTREYAKDRPRDSKGRIIVDLINPHILEDMDYFRPSALHFKKYGKYTNFKPNSNPNSEFMKWFKEEVRRSWEGYVRESDGEWVTGLMYYYMNYCPIMLSSITGENTADRIEDFPETWEGIYYRFHHLDQARYGGLYNDFKGGNHVAELARRGCSKSYSLASIMSHNLILGENKASSRRFNTVLTAYQKEFLSGKDGTLSKFVPMIDFAAQHTQFPRKRLRNSAQDMLWKMGYLDAVLGVEKGTLNTVMAVSSKDDESKLRGKRGHILVEEFGSFPRVLTIFNIVRYGVEEGGYVFGLIYLVGTSGEDDNDFGGAQELLYNAKGYNIYHTPNVYDKISQGNSTFAFFFPAYLNRKGAYNKDGVSDVTKALIEICLNRYNTKYNSSDPSTLLKVIAEMPVTPSEAILKVKGNSLPVQDLTERLGQLDSNPAEYDDVYVGDLIFNKNNEVIYTPSSSTVIRSFPHKSNKLEGAIEIFKMPEKDKDGRVFNNRYIAGIDPYDDDESDTLSLGSIFILDLWTDKLVAEYTGRCPTADETYEKWRRLLIFYNAIANYENNKKGFFGYMKKMNSLHYLSDTLEFLKDKDLVKGVLFGNKNKGTNASAPINNYALSLYKSWLLKPVPTVIKAENGEEEESVMLNLYNLKSRALIQESMLYNSVGNYDRISSIGMLMLLREDRLILYSGDLSQLKSGQASKDYLGNDDFFKNNYENKLFTHKVINR